MNYPTRKGGKKEWGIIIELLDQWICDVEEGASNTQTYREYLQQGEGEFGLAPVKLDDLTDNQDMALDLDYAVWFYELVERKEELNA